MKVNYGVEYYVDEAKKIVVCKLTGCEGSLICDMCQAGYPYPVSYTHLTLPTT